MNLLDIILIVGLAIAAFSGLKTGLIKAVISLAGLIVGVILAGQYYDSLSRWLSSYISQQNLAQVVAFAAIIIATLVAASVVASFLQRVISWVMLGWVNRLGGGIFGFLVGAVVLGSLLAILVRFPFFDLASLFQGSPVAVALLRYFPLVLGLLPEEFDAVRSFFA